MAQPDTTPLERAANFFYNGEYAKAISLAKKIIRRNANHYEAYLLLADIYREKEEKKKQEMALKKAVEVAPTVPEVYRRYGGFFEGEKRLGEAEEVYRMMIQQLPKHGDGHYYLGGVLKDLKDYKGALKAFTEAININPNDPHFYFRRSYIFDHFKNYDAALQDFNKTIELQPNDALNYSARSDLKLEMKDYQGAFADAQKAASLDSAKYTKALKFRQYEIGRAYVDKYYAWEEKDLRKAVDYLKESLKWVTRKEDISLYKEWIKDGEEKLALEEFTKNVPNLYAQCQKLYENKSYQAAFDLLNETIKKMAYTDLVMQPIYADMFMLRIKVKKALQVKENKD